MEAEILKDIEENYQKFSRPVAAFIVFENQDCQERCFAYLQTEKTKFGSVKWNKSGKALKIMDEKLEVSEAPEASDIIWENMGHSQSTIFRKTFTVWIIVIAVLNLIMFLHIFLHKPIDKINKRYPPLRICN